MNNENENLNGLDPVEPVVPENSVNSDMDGKVEEGRVVQEDWEKTDVTPDAPVVPEQMASRDFKIDDVASQKQVHLPSEKINIEVGPTTEQLTANTEGKNIPNISVNPVTGKPDGGAQMVSDEGNMTPPEPEEPPQPKMKKSKLFFIIFFFLLLGTVVFFLPEISEFVNNYGKSPEPTITPLPTETPKPTVDPDIEYQQMSCSSEFTFGSIFASTETNYYHYDKKLKIYEEITVYGKANADDETLSQIETVKSDCLITKDKFEQKGVAFTCSDNSTEFIYKKTFELNSVSGKTITATEGEDKIELPVELDQNIDEVKTLVESRGSTCAFK